MNPKSHSTIRLATALLLAAASFEAALEAAPGDRKNSTVRDVARHDDLSNKLRMAQQKDPLVELGPAAGKVEEDPSVKNAPSDFIENSTVISYRGFLTFVPKQALLHVPEKHEPRLEIEKGAKVQTFQQFLARNRGWIRTIEVSREQALGHKPFPEATVEAIKNSSSIVVATYQKGPISVLPPKEPEEEENDALLGESTSTPEIR